MPTPFESNMLSPKKEEEEIPKEEENSKVENEISWEERETPGEEKGVSVDSTPKDLRDHEEKEEEGPLAYWKNHLIR